MLLLAVLVDNNMGMAEIDSTAQTVVEVDQEGKDCVERAALVTNQNAVGVDVARVVTVMLVESHPGHSYAVLIFC